MNHSQYEQEHLYRTFIYKIIWVSLDFLVILKVGCHGEVVRRTGHFYVSFFWHVKRKKTGLYFIVLNLQQIWQWGSAFIMLWAFILGIFDTHVSWSLKLDHHVDTFLDFLPQFYCSSFPAFLTFPWERRQCSLSLFGNSCFVWYNKIRQASLS